MITSLFLSDKEIIASLWKPEPQSHKGQNGRVLIIGGSTLFSAACLWPLTVASRIVDLVHFASTEDNNAIVSRHKEEFRNGIVISRSMIADYIKEDDAIIIGPGMVRPDNVERKMYLTRHEDTLQSILLDPDEGKLTGRLTNYLLHTYSNKQWIIDAGALQTVHPSVIPKGAILTPHTKEFESLVFDLYGIKHPFNPVEIAQKICLHYDCVLVLKGETDRIVGPNQYQEVRGGNVGMTKGGTGDVLSGLIGALAAKNSPFIAAVAGCLFNKRAAEDLYKEYGIYYNASDLATQIAKTMARYMI